MRPSVMPQVIIGNLKGYQPNGILFFCIWVDFVAFSSTTTTYQDLIGLEEYINEAISFLFAGGCGCGFFGFIG